MAIGKNKRKGKKGQKKIVDPFTKKEWYDIKAPNIYSHRNVGKTIVTRTTGNRIASDQLKGRVLEISLADLNKNEEEAHLKVKLRIDDVQGKNCLTNFHGLDFTTDRLRGLVRKWQTLIDAHIDVKTADGYVVRLFTIAFTKRRPNQIRKTSYAKTSQVRQIRKRIFDIITRESTTVSLRDLFNKFGSNSIGKQIEKECQSIYPLKDVYIRKVKLLKAPKFDPAKLMEVHGEVREDTGKAVSRS